MPANSPHRRGAIKGTSPPVLQESRFDQGIDLQPDTLLQVVEKQNQLTETLFHQRQQTSYHLIPRCILKVILQSFTFLCGTSTPELKPE